MTQSILEQTKALRAGKANDAVKKILLYGEAKKGKTAMAGGILKLPFIDKVYWFDNERGFETIQTLKDAEGNYVYSEEEIAKVVLINLADYPDDPVAMVTLLEAFSSRAPVNICTAHGKINCSTCKLGQDEIVPFYLRGCTPNQAVVIDSLTQVSISSLNLSQALNSYKDLRLHYAEAGRKLNDLFTMTQTCNTNIISIAHELLIEEEKKSIGADGKVAVRMVISDILPSILSRNYAKTVSKYFGHVIYLSIENKQYAAGSDPLYKDKLMAGSRAGIDMSKYNNPGLDLLYIPRAPDKVTGAGGGIKVKLK